MRLGLLKYKFKRYQVIGLCLFVFVALFHNMICHDNNSNAINQARHILPALVPYSSTSLDKLNRNVGPFDTQDVSSLYYRHWLGTDTLGKDVLAGLIDGSYIALKVGFWTALFSLIVGLFLGYLSGYFGDNEIKIRRAYFYAALLVSLVFIFYAYYSSVPVRFILLAACPLLFNLAYAKTDIIKNKTIVIPMDLIVMKVLEIIRAIPNVFVLLVLLAMFKTASFTNIILVISLVSWPVITRHMRAEILKLKEEQFILSAKAIGQKNWRIFKNHILPLSMSPIVILVAFGFSSAVLVESTLSFLGIGVPVDQVTWGSMLREARYNFSAWWLAVFPGLMIYFVIFLFNSIGDTISDYMQKARTI